MGFCKSRTRLIGVGLVHGETDKYSLLRAGRGLRNSRHKFIMFYSQIHDLSFPESAPLPEATRKA